MADFMATYGWPTVRMLAGIIVIIVAVLIMMAYLTYYERKVLAAAMLRKGPNVVGPFGLLQPFADGLKLFVKESILPTGADPVLFTVGPILSFGLALVAWAVVPWGKGLVPSNINVGILYLFAISSLGVYGIVIAGWASNSKYAFLGAMRSAAQMVSYEVSIGFIMVTVLLLAGSLNLSKIVEAQQHLWFVVPLAPMAVLFFISGLAETNRSPFDLVESESELVAGYFVEYSAMAFALFYLGEYINMILVSAMTATLFFGGWLAPFNLPTPFWLGPFWLFAKIFVILFFFLWMRATLPRFRYDQLMRLGWKVFLPFSMFYMVAVACIGEYFHVLPGMTP
jgi:NADH-quinone oxidoreductase subunit H